MQYWARRLEQEIDGVMRIFGGVQQLRKVSCPSFTCAAFLVAVNVVICRNHLCEHLHLSHPLSSLHVQGHGCLCLWFLGNQMHLSGVWE